MSHSSSPLLPTPPRGDLSAPLLTAVGIVCLNAALYGFHMSELNAPEEFMKHSLALTNAQVGLVTSVYSVGGLIASACAGALSARYGLRPGFISAAAFFAGGALVEYRAVAVGSMVFGRFISGLGGGLALVYVPLYINEVAPVAVRGALGSMSQVSINMGILAAQLLAVPWASAEKWRSIIGAGAALAAGTLVLSVCVLEESPKWLVTVRGDEATAAKILGKLRGGGGAIYATSDEVANEIDSWKRDAASSGSASHRVSLATYLSHPVYARSRTIATAIMVGQQLSGINSIIFYGVRILTGLFPSHAVGINCTISAVNMMITFGASFFLDRLGRRVLLLMSVGAMGVASAALSGGILNGDSTITVMATFVYVGAFACGCGPIPFLLVSEVSQTEAKDLAQSWATACNLASCFAVGYAFPPINVALGGYTYLIFSAVCAVFFAFIMRSIPETKGRATYVDVWGA